MDYAKLYAVASMFTLVAYGNIMRLSKKPLLHAAQTQTEQITALPLAHCMLGDKQLGDNLQAHRQPGGKQAGGQS